MDAARSTAEVRVRQGASGRFLVGHCCGVRTLVLLALGGDQRFRSVHRDARERGSCGFLPAVPLVAVLESALTEVPHKQRVRDEALVVPVRWEHVSEWVATGYGSMAYAEPVDEC